MEKQLSDLEPGEKAVIVKVIGEGSVRRRMLDMWVGEVNYALDYKVASVIGVKRINEKARER